jgi:hypothetical protein
MCAARFCMVPVMLAAASGLADFLRFRFQVVHYRRERKREEWELDNYPKGVRVLWACVCCGYVHVLVWVCSCVRVGVLCALKGPCVLLLAAPPLHHPTIRPVGFAATPRSCSWVCDVRMVCPQEKDEVVSLCVGQGVSQPDALLVVNTLSKYV